MSNLTADQRYYLAAMEIDYWQLRTTKKTESTSAFYIFDLLDAEQQSKGVLVLDQWSSANQDQEIWKLLDAMLQAIKLFRGQSIDAYKPTSGKLLLVMGEFAAQKIFNSPQNLENFREKNTAQQITTYHPLHLLKNPQDKRKAWNDLQVFLGK